MSRSEYSANEALAATPAKREARVHYQVARSVGPIEIIFKLSAFVGVIVAILYLMVK